MTSFQTWTVPDISCQHCVDAITTEVGAVDGVTDVARRPRHQEGRRHRRSRRRRGRGDRRAAGYDVAE